ncbi:diguanylate cyclase [Xanthomonas sp. AmX2]|uniref:ligand-binding sensor domain-containing diguanylate cyclase n=1 Tax=Xanthomonas sp. TaxID=29446 RepID=UPI001981C86A|nr:ligand-binding sensor domain-containing diguanylate cyclase [Xanthomonas sp.]MBN6151070.1 diguanylate cyclase [Xanthomonas sp.]
MLARLSLLLLLLLSTGALDAQTLQPAYRDVVRRYSTDDGLPQNSVNAIVQDRDGFLWLGTFGGLARFDGSEFTVYRSLADGGPSSDRILQLLYDARGQLWIGSEDAGVSVYRDGRFLRLGLCEGRCLVRGFVPDADGTLWVLSSSGLFRVDPVGLRTLAHDPAVLDTAAAAGGDGRIYLGGSGGLSRMRRGRREAVALPVAAADATVTGLHRDGDVLWIGTGQAVLRYDTRRQAWLPPLPPSPALNGVQALSRDAAQRMWLADVHGRLFRHDGPGLQPLQDPQLASALARSLFADRDGNLWIGSNARGLLRVAQSRIGLLDDPAAGLDLPGLPVVGDGGKGLWLGTICGGLQHWDANSGRLRRWSLQRSVGNECVWSLHRDDQGGLWIGTIDGRLGYLPRAAQSAATAGADAAHNGAAVRFVAQWPDQLPIRALYRRAKHQLLVGTGHGVYALPVGDDGRTGQPQAVPGLTGSVNLIQPAQQGGLWLAGSEGLMRWRRQQVVERWTTARGLSSRFVRSLHEQSDGTLWVGTYGGGLNRIADGRVRHFDRSHGLFDDVVSCIVADPRGGLWLSGNRGISLLPAEELRKAAAGSSELTALGFSESDGLDPAETNGGGQPACLRDAAGALWFPLISGFARIDPGAIGTRRAAPPVRIVSVDSGGRAVPFADPLPLHQRNRDIEVRFAAINLSSPEKTRFRYRLSRPQQPGPWIDIGAQRSLHFPLLPWGRSTLEIIARSDSGDWSATPARLRFDVPPPWYLRPLAWCLGAALLVATLLSGWYLRGYRLRRRRDALTRLVRKRTLELEQANRRLLEQSQRDPMTGLANRRHCEERLQALWAQTAERGQPLSALMIDIDQFKLFNDHYGHLAGDECLRQVAQAMDAQVRADGMLARYGGEEFVALLPNCDPDQAQRVAERLRNAVEACALAHAPSAIGPYVTVSVGCASKWPAENRSAVRLLDIADRALYRAKENGRNRVEALAA